MNDYCKIAIPWALGCCIATLAQAQIVQQAPSFVPPTPTNALSNASSNPLSAPIPLPAPRNTAAATETLQSSIALQALSDQVMNPQVVEWTLDQAVAMAISNHPSLREARAAIDEARGFAYQAGLYPNPRIDSGNPQTLGGANSVYSFGVTQEVIRGGKRQLDVAAAERAVQRSQFEYMQRQYALITDVRQAFVAVLASQERIRILELLLAVARELEQTSDNLVKAGQSSEADLLLLRLERRRAETTLQATRAELEGRRALLAAQIGLPEFPIRNVLGDLMMAIPNYESILLDEQVIDQNAGINAGRSEVARSRELLQRAIVEPIPNVTVQGGTQYTVSQPHEQALVGVYVDIPIWNRNQGNIRAAESTVRKVSAAVSTARTEIAKRLADALARYRAAGRQVESYETGILPDARRTLELVRSGYDRGQFDIVRLVQAQRSVFEVSLEYIQALELRLNAAAEISGLLQSDVFP
ncbi:MAG: TolC family protein [Planctomycetota bacterium]